MSVTLVNPAASAAGAQITTRYGNSYTADANGSISVNAIDVLDLMAAGYMPLPPSAGSDALSPAADALTAHAGGGQTSALALTAVVNRVATVATGADSVKLPASVAGLTVVVINDAATNALQVFGKSPDTINDVATATGVSQLAGTAVAYHCPVAGKWYATGQGVANVASLSGGTIDNAVIGGTTPAAATVTDFHVDTGTKTATAVAGAATLNKRAGVVTSESLTTAAGADYTLTLTNSTIAAADQVMASVATGTNTTAGLHVHEVTPAAGSVTIKVRNGHATTALNGTIVIAFVVIKN